MIEAPFILSLDGTSKFSDISGVMRRIDYVLSLSFDPDYWTVTIGKYELITILIVCMCELSNICDLDVNVS